MGQVLCTPFMDTRKEISSKHEIFVETKGFVVDKNRSVSFRLFMKSFRKHLYSFFHYSQSMIYEKIQEPIEVLAAFRKEQTEPMVFKWGNRYYQIGKVNFIHSEHDGLEKIFYFSVSNDSSSYRLSFRTKSLRWMLEEMCEAGA